MAKKQKLSATFLNSIPATFGNYQRHIFSTCGVMRGSRGDGKNFLLQSSGGDGDKPLQGRVVSMNLCSIQIRKVKVGLMIEWTLWSGYSGRSER